MRRGLVLASSRKVEMGEEHDDRRILTFRRCVLTTSGFSCSAASFLALLSFLIKAIGLRVIPRLNFLRARDESKGRSSTGFMVSKASRSTPRKVNFLKVLRFGCTVPGSGILSYVLSFLSIKRSEGEVADV